jgi:16S rRNA (guanine527-N7)-methyltransferase
MGLAVPEPLVEAMAAHQRLVERWSAKMNLTAVKDPARAAELHGLDSLLVAELFEPEAAATVADVGSGAGFPGIVLALARPKLRVRLLEPHRKRASFLRVALAELRRPDVEVQEARLEPLEPGRAPAWRAEAIVSRATLPPLELVGLAPPYLEPGGRLVLMAGAGAPEPQGLARVAKEAGLMPVDRLLRHLPGGEVRILDVLVDTGSASP